MSETPVTGASIEEIVAGDDRSPEECFGDILYWLENNPSPGETLPLDQGFLAVILADWRAKKAEIKRLRRDIGETTLHWADRVENEAEAMRAKCEQIARNVDLYDGDRLKNSDPRITIADAIAALKQS